MEEEEEEEDDDEVVFESVENLVETTIFTNPKLVFLTTKRGRRAKARIKAEGIFGFSTRKLKLFLNPKDSDLKIF